MKLRVMLSLKLILHTVLSLEELCDRARTARIWEGNLGQSAHFNWLGVLIVRLQEWGGKHHTAMTGLVLIKFKYALANADDVVRIPQKIFNKNSRATFFPARDTPWFVKPSSYVTHPEYRQSVVNSIAIIQLNLDKVNNFPLTPVCMPTAQRFQASEYLYLSGFTDDNKKLEKIIYRIQSVDEKSCEDYYNDKGDQFIPSKYVCGYAPNSGTQCDWENGMALVSNTTGHFSLMGLAIHGPGCTAPARFLDLFPYLPWIQSLTGSDQGFENDGSRRKTGPNQLVPNVPIHELYASQGGPRRDFNPSYEPYPFDVDTLKFYVVKPTESNTTLIIAPLDKQWERYTNACSQHKEVIYKEYFELRALDNMRGTVEYKLSLYDNEAKPFACVRLTMVQSKGATDAVLSFKEDIFDYSENKELGTPEELFRYFPLLQRDFKSKNNNDWIKTDEFLNPSIINADQHFFSSEPLIICDLYIRFEFYERARLHFEMYGEGEGVVTDSIIFASTTTIEPTTTEYPETSTKKANKRRRKKPVTIWGLENWQDYSNKVKERLVVDEAEPRVTVSAARGEVAPGAVLLACWLVSAGLTTLFLIP